MKSQKIITIIAIILLILIITLASFLGIYKKEEYRVSNVVPDYVLGMEFANSRVLNLKVDTGVASTTIYDSEGNVVEQEEGKEYKEEDGYTTVENKVNPDDILTTENYKKQKSILLDRLNKLGVEQYTIKQNENDGKIQIEMTEDDNTEEIMSVLAQNGKFELVDSETKEVLLNNSNIKNTKLVYGQDSSGVSVYLQIEFNKDGKSKLEEISKTYIKTTEQVTDENGETKDEEVTKNVDILFDGETFRTTYFGEPIADGNLNVMIGSATNSAALQQYVVTATEMKIILDTGILPITYSASSYEASAPINSTTIIISAYVLIGILAIMLVYLIIKFKVKGLLAVLLQIGYISLLLLTVRYTNVKITIEGVVGIIISSVLNYMYIYNVFISPENRFVKDITAKFSLKIVPIYIIAIIFTFNKVAYISSLGMTLVWGLIIMYLYNLVLTQITVKTIQNK